MQRNKSRNTESKVRITIANSSSFQQLGINLKNEKKSVKELADFIFQVDNDLQSKIITPIQQKIEKQENTLSPYSWNPTSGKSTAATAAMDGRTQSSRADASFIDYDRSWDRFKKTPPPKFRALERQQMRSQSPIRQATPQHIGQGFTRNDSLVDQRAHTPVKELMDSKQLNRIKVLQKGKFRPGSRGLVGPFSKTPRVNAKHRKVLHSFTVYSPREKEQSPQKGRIYEAVAKIQPQQQLLMSMARAGRKPFAKVGEQNELRFFKDNLADARDKFGVRNITLMDHQRSPPLITEPSQIETSARRAGSFLLEYKVRRQKMLDELDDMREKEPGIKLPSVRGGRWDTNENHNRLLKVKCQKWMNDRTKSNERQQTSHDVKQRGAILSFARQLFEFWDSDKKGCIPLEDITMDFLALGLAPNAEFVAKIAENVTQSGAGSLQFEDFQKILQGGSRVDKILEVLNFEIRKKSKRREERTEYMKLMKRCLEGGSDFKVNFTSNQTFTAATPSSTNAFEQALANLKLGDHSLARNLMRRLTGSSRHSLKSYDIRKPRRAILWGDKSVEAKPPNSPTARDLYFVSYLHRFHQNKIEIKEESKLNRKKLILLEIKGDLKKYFHLSYPVPKDHYKQQLERYSAIKKARSELSQKYGNVGARIFFNVMEAFGRMPQTIEQQKNKDVKKLINMVLGQIKQQAKFQFKFPNEKMIYHFEQVMEWWDELNEKKMDLIKLSEFQEFLVQKGIISDVREYVDISKQFLNGHPGTWIRQAQFLRVFVKSIFKGAIMNVYEFVEKSRNIANWLPLSIKVLAYQRKLMMSAFKLNDKEKLKEGRNLLSALSKIGDDAEPVNSQEYIDIMSEIVNQTIAERERPRSPKLENLDLIFQETTYSSKLNSPKQLEDSESDSSSENIL